MSIEVANYNLVIALQKLYNARLITDPIAVKRFNHYIDYLKFCLLIVHCNAHCI